MSLAPGQPGFISTDLLATGTWNAFERALLRLVLHRGFEWARLTAGPGDRGSDIIGYFRGHYWVIQAKFSLNKVPPGPKVMEELARAIGEYQATQAILATNAPIADSRALQVAAAQFKEQTGVNVALLGHNELRAELTRLPADPPYLSSHPIRPYQSEAVDRIKHAAMTRTGAAAGAIVAMATGTGKSRVLAEYLRSFFEINPSAEALVLVESIELARQLERSSWDVLPKLVSTHLWAGGEIPAFACGSSVTFATTDSVRGGWGMLAWPQRFRLIVFDEAHHAAAEANRQLLTDLAGDFRLGMTATPWRGDDLLLEQVFGGHAPIFRLSVVDAIKSGYLAEVDYQVYDDHVDWAEVKRRSQGTMSIRDLNRRLWIPERENRIAEIVREWIDRLAVGGVPPRTLIFCRSIEHTEKARIALNAAGVPAAELHSDLPKFEVTRTLQKFRDGEIRVLAVVDMLNEGIDVPDVQLIVFNRVTHSRRVFLQQLGRGLRKTPDKDVLTVIDFVADVRRLMELLEMERDYQTPRPTAATIDLPANLVNFTSQDMEQFVDAYLRDVGDLDHLADDSLILFPPDANHGDAN